LFELADRILGKHLIAMEVVRIEDGADIAERRRLRDKRPPSPISKWNF
jgi:hypothetical protein